MDLNSFVIGCMGVFLLLGLIVIGIGVFMRKYGIRINKSKEIWCKQMVSWQILEQESVPSLIADNLLHSFVYIQSFAFIYAHSQSR